MAKENTQGHKPGQDASKGTDLTKLAAVPKPAATKGAETAKAAPLPKTGAAVSPPAAKNTPRSGGKGNRPQVGGTAVPGAKSTQPKPVSNTNNAQQQEMENANRMMRRRMQQLGTGAYSNDKKPPKTLADKRKEKLERLKQRRQAQVDAVKRTLPGGRLSTDTRRVYYLIASIAIAIILLIVVFVVLRVTHVLK